MANGREARDEERTREARDALARLSDQSDTIGASAMGRAADRARDNFGATDADPDDEIELWGRRIGRGLGLLAFVGLAVYLVVAYVLPKM